MSEQTLDAVRRIRERLHRTARRIDLSELLFGLIITIAVATAAWTLLAALEWLLWMGTVARTTLLAVWIATSLGMVLILVAPPALRLLGILPRISDDEVALRIGNHFPLVSDRLINLIQLSSGKSTSSSDGFIDGAVAMLSHEVNPVPFEKVEQFDRPRKTGLRMMAAPALLLLFAVGAPAPFSDASTRLLSPRTEFDRPAPFAFHVVPGTVEITRGDELQIRAHTVGSVAPASAVIMLLSDDLDRPEQLAMESTGTGRFEHRIGAVGQSFRYQVAAEGIESPWYDVEIIERPLIRGVQVRVDYPSYTGLPPHNLPAGQGNVTALRGSRVNITSAVSGNDVQSVVVEFDEAEVVEMDFDGDSATTSFRIRHEDSYRIIARTSDGVSSADPISFHVAPTDDSPPTVRLLSPAPDVTLGESLESLIGAVIVDDYGFSRLELRYRLSESRYRAAQAEFGSIQIPIHTPRPIDQEVVHQWALAETDLDPVPGDVIEYYLEVWDNDVVSGPKRARSQIQRLRVPSLAEQYDELDRIQDSTTDELQRMLEEAGEIRRDFDDLRNELRGRQESDWQSRRQVESLQQRQEQIEQRVDELTQQMQDVTRHLEDNNLLSDETIEMYRELTRVVDEIKSPELIDALKQLQEAMEQLDLQQMQESLQDFEFNEDQYRQRLERSLELFKRARTLQHLEQAERMARELAENQRELRDATERLTGDEGTPPTGADRPDEAQNQPDPGASDADQTEDLADDAPSDSDSPSESTPETSPSHEQLADEQERLSQEMEALEQKLDDIRMEMDDVGSSPREEMDQLRDEVRERQLPQNMRDASQQIRSDQTQEAGQKQQQMQEQLEQLQSRLGEMKSGMSGAQMQMNLNGLRRTIRDVILLSQQQEDLQKSTVETGSGSPSLPVLARDQVRIAEGVSVVADSVQSLANQIAEISREAQRHTGEALREMERATGALVERTSREAGTHQRSGMTHLNELGLMLSDLLDQLMNQQAGGSGGGGMSAEEMANQLQQMAQDQQQLNSQIQQMLNDSAGDRLSSDMQERLSQMAAQQEAIRRQLRQLSRDPGARDHNAMNDLNRIADQMQQTIEELQERGASRQTIERQQQILTRLLEAEKSLQEREQDERRRGQTGQDIQRDSPPELQRSEEMERLRRDLLRALESDYAPDYQNLIRRYFELLQREAEQQH